MRSETVEYWNVVAGLIVIASHLDVLIYMTIDLVAYSCLSGSYT
jgi:hypothetical protein